MDEQSHLFEQAISARESGNHLLAEKLFKKGIALDDAFGGGWILYATFLKNQKRWEEAIVAAKHATADENCRASALSVIGQCFMDQEQWPQAEEAFRKSLDIRSKAYTFVFLGFTLTELGRDVEAILAYKSALEIEPEFDEAHYNLGCITVSRENMKRQSVIFDELLLRTQTMHWLTPN